MQSEPKHSPNASLGGFDCKPLHLTKEIHLRQRTSRPLAWRMLAVGGILAASQAVSAQQTSTPGTTAPDMLGEWANCRIPQQIQFIRERQGPWWPGPFGITRKERYEGGALETKAFKNPEAHEPSGPGHVQNCSTGQAADKNTQWLSFKLKTTSYFAAGAMGDHIAIVLRAKVGPPGAVVGPWGRDDYLRTPQYHGRGIILHRTSGVQGEHFSLGQPSGRQTLQTGSWATGVHPLRLQDGVVYTLHVVVSDTSVAYQVIDPNGLSIAWSPSSVWHELPDDSFVIGGSTTNARTLGSGLALVALCNQGASMGCDGASDQRAFTIELTDISSGWF
jgi:hypothetical protein